QKNLDSPGPTMTQYDHSAPAQAAHPQTLPRPSYFPPACCTAPSPRSSLPATIQTAAPAVGTTQAASPVYIPRPPETDAAHTGSPSAIQNPDAPCCAGSSSAAPRPPASPETAPPAAQSAIAAPTKPDPVSTGSPHAAPPPDPSAR